MAEPPAPRQLCCGLSKKPTMNKENCEPVGSWVTLAAVFVMNVLIIIPMNGFGVFYNHLVDKFNTTRAMVGLVYLLFICLNGFIGLISAPYISRYGTKRVCLVASVLQTLSYVACSFTPDIWSFLATFGIIAAMGHALVETTSIVIVQEVFNHNRGLATGIACVAFNIGDITAPFLLDSLLDGYGLSGMLLIHAAIQANSIPITMMYSDVRITSKNSESSTSVVNKNASLLLSDKCNLRTEAKMFSSLEVFTYSSSIPDLRLQSLEDSKGTQASRSNKPLYLEPMPHEKNTINYVPISIQSADALYSNSMPELRMNPAKPMVAQAAKLNLKMPLSATDGENPNTCVQANVSDTGKNGNDNVHMSLLDVQTGVGNEQYTPEKYHSTGQLNGDIAQCQENCHKMSVKDTLKEIVDFKILKNKSFSMLLLVRVMWLVIKYSLMTNTVSAAVYKGMDETTAAGVVSVYGFSCLCSVVMCTLLLSRNSLNKMMLYGIGIMLGTIAGLMAITGSVYKPTFLYASMSFLGLGEGITYTTALVVVVGFVGVENLPKALAFMNLIATPALLAAGPFSGWLVDRTGEYLAPFLFVTVLGVIASSLSVVLRIFYAKWLQQYNMYKT